MWETKHSDSEELRLAVLTQVHCPRPTGTYCQAVWHDAVPDWLRHLGRGHHHCPLAQQPQAARETHHQDGGGDICELGAKEPGTQVCVAPLAGRQPELPALEPGLLICSS